jgi:hypothetical protein
MKWYHIRFSTADLFANSDEKFVSQFVKLLHNLKHPDNLGLYTLKFQMDEGLVYYASAPIEYDYEVKKMLAYFPSQEVSRPNLKVLKLELGKNGIMKEV